MPTYEYECQACRHRFEVFHSITDAPRKRCPRCGKNRVKRLLGTGAGLLFKGSGFYTTDYRSDSYKKAAKAETSTPAPASKDGGAKTEAKPAKSTKT